MLNGHLLVERAHRLCKYAMAKDICVSYVALAAHYYASSLDA
jgi:hypothetical protein